MIKVGDNKLAIDTKFDLKTARKLKNKLIFKTIYIYYCNLILFK